MENGQPVDPVFYEAAHSDYRVGGDIFKGQISQYLKSLTIGHEESRAVATDL